MAVQLASRRGMAYAGRICRPLPRLDAQQFARWAALLEARTGISLPATRNSFLSTSLGTRMRELGMSGFDEYYAYLTAGTRGAVEWEVLVDRLTVHETRFYRDRAALDVIAETVVEPRLEGGDGPLRLDLWSVGCATGEEPYTLAVHCDQQLAASGRPYYLGVTASDISLASLAAGRSGVYHRMKLTQVPVEILQRYFLPVDLDHYQVVERIRERICFTRANVLELSAAAVGTMDVIVCQNVLIYFRPEVRRAIIGALARHLRPGGLLIAGLGDLVGWSHPDLVPLASPNVLAWRRPLEETA